MTASTTKDFGPILDDYAFFETNSTEADADLAGYLPHLEALPGSGPVRLLDFGCGAGRFSSMLLGRAGLAPDRLHLSLVEPDESSRRQAVARLAGFTGHPVHAWPALPDTHGGVFDLVVANHCLYYVPDLEGVLGRLLGLLAGPGLFLTAIAPRENVLIHFWLRSFALLGKPMPYHIAEDVEAALARRGALFRRTTVAYDLAFPDTEENRLRILRFLLSEHLQELPRGAALALFDPYSQAGQVRIHTVSRQFAVPGPARGA